MSNDYPRRVRDVLASQNKRSISIILTNTGPSSEASGGNHVVDIGADDYTEDTKTIAHTFAVATIDEAQNTYKPSNQYQQASLLNGNGYPAAISDEFEDDYYLGKETVGADGKAMFVNLSDSDLLNINIIKGKATATDDSSRNYMDLLAEVNRSNGEQSNSQLSINVERATLNVNSNASNSKFVVEGILEDESNIGKLTIQSLKGKYSKIPSYVNLENNATNPSQNGYTVKPNQLKNLGSQLPLVASGEIYVPNDINDPIEYGKGLAGALVPGAARSGASRVSAKGMQAASTLNRVTNGDFSRDTSVSDLDTDDILSYGNYNSWLVPFEGRDEFTMPMLGIQILALGFVCEAAAELIKLEFPSNKRNSFMNSFYKGFLISFGLIAPENVDGKIFKEILLKAVAQGVLSSTGLGPVGNFVKLNNEWLTNPWKQNSGWIIMQVRSTMRKIANDIVGFVDIGETMSNLSNTGKGDSDALYSNTRKSIFNSNIFKVIKVFSVRGSGAAPYSNSKSALNIAKNVGVYENLSNRNDDQVMLLNSSEEQMTFASVPRLESLNKKMQLSRGFNLGGGDNPQTIANASTRSKMILPKTLNIATTYASGDESQLSQLAGDAMSGYQYSENTRLSIDEVKEFEEYLNSSYMPFYFHDLRTNEIISFHAFLNNMSDNFSVDWQNNPAYGRVEPIFQYTGTTRELQVDFYILATNELDHSRMWAKINKLVTLVYPQFTKGRALETTDNKKFIQPFSQIPGGSPVFRIRVGDVWKSNYNTFNVMRLFGLGQPEFDLAGGEGGVISQQIRSERERITREITDRIAAGNLLRDDVIDIVYNRSEIVSIAGLGGIRNDSPELRAVLSERAVTSTTSLFFGWGDANTTGLAGWVPPADILSDGTYTYTVINSRTIGTEAVPFINQSVLQMVSPPDSLNTRVGGDIESTTDQLQNLLNASPGLQVLDAGGYRGFIYGPGPVSMIIPILDPVPADDPIARGGGQLTPEEIAQIERNGLRNTAVSDWSTATADLLDGTSSVINQQLARVNGILRRRPNPNWLQQKVNRELAPLQAELDRERSSVETQRRLVSEFFNADQNPIIKSFKENGAGGGLAVVCKSMGFDWNDSRWETNYTSTNNNSRAPMWLKVTMGMTAIHDIVPGISADGYMTAPVYPVGPIATVTDKLESIQRSESDSRTPSTE
jgi:hypothetical protein